MKSGKQCLLWHKTEAMQVFICWWCMEYCMALPLMRDTMIHVTATLQVTVPMGQRHIVKLFVVAMSQGVKPNGST